MEMDHEAAASFIAEAWADDLVGQLTEYVGRPALSPSFDADWQQSGHIEGAVDQIVRWIESRTVEGMTVEVQRIDGLTPLIVVEVDRFGGSTTEDTTILYGHLDKQPEMTGWREGLGPWTPVIEDGRLYGRGGADDGYAAFASLVAIEAVQQSGGQHGRCVLLVEASEESGSPDLPAHIDLLADRLGEVSLVLCLDSGCATYDTMWLTTSLRGLVHARLTASILTEGLHSGSAGGVVPSSFRILRQLLDRVEDATDGRVLIDSAHVEIPPYRIAEAEAVGAELGEASLESPPFVDGAHACVETPAEGLLSKTWRPSLSITGADGLPPTAKAGNVLRPSTSLQLSLRVPPTADARRVLEDLSATLTADPPYGATITLDDSDAADGWHAPDLQPWLAEALGEASQRAFGNDLRLYGEGGTIPFMGMLGAKFPEAQFVITGVLGPGSNAHGPNEFLDLAYAEKLTNCIASVLASR